MFLVKRLYKASTTYPRGTLITQRTVGRRGLHLPISRVRGLWVAAQQ